MSFPSHGWRRAALLLPRVAISVAVVAVPWMASPARSQPVAAPAANEESATGLAETVVTASRVDERLTDALPHTTVLTQEDIRNAQVPDVVTLLRREAGIETPQNGGIGHVAGLLIRGAPDSGQALVMIDGVRLNNLSLGTAPLEQILVDQIERIEIVRGDVSALYGSDAAAGVIQIFTKRGSGAPHLSAAVGAGSLSTRNAQADYGGELGDTRFNLGWSVYHTTGFSALRTEVSPNVDGDDDGYSNQTLSASLSQRIATASIGEHIIGGSFFQSDGRVDTDNAFAASPDDKQKDSTQVGVWQIYWDARFLSPWHSRLAFGRTTDYFQEYVNANPTDKFNQHNNQLTWQNDVALGRSSTATLGLEQLKQSLDSTDDFGRTERTVRDAFVQLKSTLGRNQFQVSGRYNHYSDFGHHNVYYLGYGFLLTDTIKLMASESTGFHAPSFDQLFFPPIGGFTTSNPSLGPEKARTSELGAQWASAQQFLRLTAFRTRYQNLIAETPSTGFIPENINSADVRGMELSYRGRFLTLDWTASATLQRPWDNSDNTWLLHVARRYANLGVARAWGPLRAGLNWHVSGNKQDTDPFTFETVQVAGYGVLDATLAYDIAPAWKLGVRAVNLFDKDYTLVEGYNVQHRGIFLTLAYRP